MSTPSRVEERIPYVILFVTDIERSVRFYHERLGLPKRAFEPASRMGGIALAIQGTTIVLLDAASAGFSPDGGYGAGQCHPSFAVANLANFHASAIANEVDCVEAPRDDQFGRFAVYRDPDGLLFSVVEERKQAEKHAVVLSGGGALGAFELGVLRHLAEPDTPDPVIFTGTSVGAFNAAVLTCEFTRERQLSRAVDILVDIWRTRVAGGLFDNGVYRMRGDLTGLLSGTLEPVRELAGDAAYLSTEFAKRLANLASPWARESMSERLMGMVDMSTMISTEPLEELIQHHVSWDRVRMSPRALKIATTDWASGAPQVFVHDPNAEKLGSHEQEFTAQNLHRAILASVAIPGLFPPVTIPAPDGSPHVDGGVVMNSPLRPAIDAGADVIHMICLNPEVNTLPLRPLGNTMDSFTRLLIASTAMNVATDLDRAKFINKVAGVARRESTGHLYRSITVHRYNPKPGNLGGLAGILDFSLGHIEALMEDGVDRATTHDCDESGCVIPGR